MTSFGDSNHYMVSTDIIILFYFIFIPWPSEVGVPLCLLPEAQGPWPTTHWLGHNITPNLPISTVVVRLPTTISTARKREERGVQSIRFPVSRKRIERFKEEEQSKATETSPHK